MNRGEIKAWGWAWRGIALSRQSLRNWHTYKWLINQSIASLQYASYQSQYQQINSNSNYVEAFD